MSLHKKETVSKIQKKNSSQPPKINQPDQQTTSQASAFSDRKEKLKAPISILGDPAAPGSAVQTGPEKIDKEELQRQPTGALAETGCLLLDIGLTLKNLRPLEDREKSALKGPLDNVEIKLLAPWIEKAEASTSSNTVKAVFVLIPVVLAVGMIVVVRLKEARKAAEKAEPEAAPQP